MRDFRFSPSDFLGCISLYVFDKYSSDVNPRAPYGSKLILELRMFATVEREDSLITNVQELFKLRKPKMYGL